MEGYHLLSSKPVVDATLGSLTNTLKTAYKQFSNAEFDSALVSFRHMVLVVPLLVLDKEADLHNVVELLRISSEYLSGIRLELARQKAHHKQSLQLAISMCFCDLQPAHKLLVLRKAIAKCYNSKNYKATSHLCKMLFDLHARQPDLIQ
mmetsp:Transcript_14988/g.7297  ORF Transcript_14988/g.7297 Transcript_14988/m.7297 type:complete len:149 (-) Transcript_14988:330-776(-)|eukprot:CAMPEP_0201283272 /NCGR_PEP_ID=MMETSP1317-20130820/8121_1 /ASSEMBLY_ACC=CAM_ASM_000770 /TAXON_ID=187299 /ORGANISM="Undescribed Undescribed, Strain Undescribed" /LENGTH=148 /DNA_ID=CAMNT_0047598965 /DNA_START=231 /DNA_END=677 /DNA_ORIENTATION=+